VRERPERSGRRVLAGIRQPGVRRAFLRDSDPAHPEDAPSAPHRKSRARREGGRVLASVLERLVWAVVTGTGVTSTNMPAAGLNPLGFTAIRPAADAEHEWSGRSAQRRSAEWWSAAPDRTDPLSDT